MISEDKVKKKQEKDPEIAFNSTYKHTHIHLHTLLRSDGMKLSFGECFDQS